MHSPRLRFTAGISRLAVCVLLFSTAARAAAVPGWLVNPALEIVNDPLLLPLDCHLDFIDLMPAYPGRRLQVELPLSSIVFGLGSAAASAKVLIINEGEFYPRVAVSGGYFTNVAMKLLPDIKAKMEGYDYGISIAKTVDETEQGPVELFGGIRSLYDVIEFEPKDPLEIVEGTQISKIGKTGFSTIAHFGIMKRGKNHEVSSQVGVDLSRGSVFLHFMFGGKTARYGFGVYPDSILFIKPFFAIHLRF